MPIYDYICDTCRHTNSQYVPMSFHRTPMKCPTCETGMRRDFQSEAAGPYLDVEFHKPIEMHSIALCNGEDIKDFRRRNPDVEIGTDPSQDNYGVPVAHNRSEKLRILNSEGYQEKN